MRKDLIIFGMICTILGFLLSVYLLATGPKLILPLAYGQIEQQSNQTNTTNETTNNLLKQLIKIENTTQALQQDNAKVIATKLDNLRVELQHQQHKIIIPPVLPSTNPGCGLGTDNSLCNVPVPPYLSSPPPFNATTCKPQNDNGVLIYPCPLSTFPNLEQPLIPPPAPLPLPPHLENILPPSANLPPIPPPFLANLPPDLGMGPVTDCIYTIYGVFCPTN